MGNNFFISKFSQKEEYNLFLTTQQESKTLNANFETGSLPYG